MKSFLLAVLLLISTKIYAQDYDASNCEIFVDQVSAWSGTYGYAGVSLFVKTLNDRLDGKIKQVGMYAQIQSTEAARKYCEKSNNKELNDCNKLGVWQDIKAQRFFADDYNVIHIDLRHMNTFEHIWEAAFYVTTDKGVTLWFTPESDGNFFIDENMRGNILDLGSGGYRHYGKKINTADKFIYMNPAKCR
jgi:hypothetical protein